MFARAIGIGIIFCSAFLTGMENNSSNILELFEKDDVDTLFENWKNDQQSIQEFDNEVDFYLYGNHITENNVIESNINTLLSNNQLKEVNSDFEYENSEEQEFVNNDKVFKEEIQTCKDCKTEHSNSTIHKIFYCKYPYIYGDFLYKSKVDDKTVYTCKGCNYGVEEYKVHAQTCNELSFCIYLRYCASCDSIFRDHTSYLAHIENLNCNTENSSTMNCPINNCNDSFNTIKDVQTHCKEKHSEKEVLTAFKSKQWYGQVKTLKRSREIFEDNNKPLKKEKRKKPFVQSTFERLEGTCSDCKEKYINFTLHKIFYCEKKPYSSSNFVITEKEKHQCTKCWYFFKKRNGHDHVYNCQDVPILYIGCCSQCDLIFRSRKQFSRHKENCEKAKPVCCIKDCSFDDKSMEKVKWHYKRKHTEEALFLALQNKRWYVAPRT